MTNLSIILPLVKPGDRVRIVPRASVPNAQREFKVNAILPDGFLFGVTERCDGYILPFMWIKEIAIIG